MSFIKSKVGVDEFYEIVDEIIFLNGSRGELETMIASSVVTIVQEFASFLKLLGDIKSIDPIEIVFSSEDDSLRKLFDLCHRGFAWEHVEVCLRFFLIIIGSVFPGRWHEMLDLLVGEFDGVTPG